MAGFDSYMGEERREVWVVLFIVDDEARVDFDSMAALFDAYRIGMPAKPFLGFVQSDMMAL